jgi:LysR family transcriptional regulator, glycine cleavage system transcriptional activator
MALKLPPLSGLRLFEAAARCGSFKAAAHELNLTPRALSHGINSLENYLDVELFERKAHGIILTAAGRQYLPYVSETLALIATGTLRLPSRRFEERLSISSFSLFAHKVLLPRLHKFQALYPNMTVVVDVSREMVHLPSDEFDVAIRSGRDSWPKLSCDLLGRLAFVPVGAPGYLRDISPGGALDCVAVDHIVPVLTGYWLVAPRGVETRHKIIAFRNWLLEETSQLNWRAHSAKASVRSAKHQHAARRTS